MSQEFDSSPQAAFVKARLRLEMPGISEEQLEALWQQKLEAARQQLGEGNCLSCGS